MTAIALHPGLLRCGVIFQLQEEALPCFPAIIKLEGCFLIQLVKATLTPVILFVSVCVVCCVAADLCHPTLTTAEKGGRVQDTPGVPTKGAGITALLLWLPLDI